MSNDQCGPFVDDPDAPGCCIGCGEPREAHRPSNLRVIEPFKSADGVEAEVFKSTLGGPGCVIIKAEVPGGEETEVTLNVREAHDLMLWLRCALSIPDETPALTKRLRDARLNWAMACPCTCKACDEFYEAIRDICSSAKASELPDIRQYLSGTGVETAEVTWGYRAEKTDDPLGDGVPLDKRQHADVSAHTGHHLYEPSCPACHAAAPRCKHGSSLEDGCPDCDAEYVDRLSGPRTVGIDFASGPSVTVYACREHISKPHGACPSCREAAKHNAQSEGAQ